VENKVGMKGMISGSRWNRSLDKDVEKTDSWWRRSQK